ncbi:hypothetical protein, partial [Candidatus Avelusimicrobium facis]|uniref:hypothetical protein n=1 Tax=Candidatus Avelusimicrobium facis TaxID=3416203 RepID=UPI003D097E6A
AYVFIFVVYQTRGHPERLSLKAIHFLVVAVALIRQTTGKMEDAEQRRLSMTLFFITAYVFIFVVYQTRGHPERFLFRIFHFSSSCRCFY